MIGENFHRLSAGKEAAPLEKAGRKTPVGVSTEGGKRKGFFQFMKYLTAPLTARAMITEIP